MQSKLHANVCDCVCVCVCVCDYDTDIYIYIESIDTHVNRVHV